MCLTDECLNNLRERIEQILSNNEMGTEDISDILVKLDDGAFHRIDADAFLKMAEKTVYRTGPGSKNLREFIIMGDRFTLRTVDWNIAGDLW